MIYDSVVYKTDSNCQSVIFFNATIFHSVKNVTIKSPNINAKPFTKQENPFASRTASSEKSRNIEKAFI